MSRRGVKLLAQRRRPVAIEGVQLNDGSGTDVANDQPNPTFARVSDIVGNVPFLIQKFRFGWQALVSQRTQARCVNDIRSRCRRNVCLIPDISEVIKGMTGNTNR
jgi:hypothetical protein